VLNDKGHASPPRWLSLPVIFDLSQVGDGMRYVSRRFSHEVDMESKPWT